MSGLNDGQFIAAEGQISGLGLLTSCKINMEVIVSNLDFKLADEDQYQIKHPTIFKE